MQPVNGRWPEGDVVVAIERPPYVGHMTNIRTEAGRGGDADAETEGDADGGADASDPHHAKCTGVHICEPATLGRMTTVKPSSDAAEGAPELGVRPKLRCV